jgi:hypothetical protein
VSLRTHTSGNRRPWETRPSDHLQGSRAHIHGPIHPMEDGGTTFLARLFGRG